MVSRLFDLARTVVSELLIEFYHLELDADDHSRLATAAQNLLANGVDIEAVKAELRRLVAG